MVIKRLIVIINLSDKYLDFNFFFQFFFHLKLDFNPRVVELFALNFHSFEAGNDEKKFHSQKNRLSQDALFE